MHSTRSRCKPIQTTAIVMQYIVQTHQYTLYTAKPIKTITMVMLYTAKPIKTITIDSPNQLHTNHNWFTQSTSHPYTQSPLIPIHCHLLLLLTTALVSLDATSDATAIAVDSDDSFKFASNSANDGSLPTTTKSVVPNAESLR